jgi:hypothetical protein
VNAKSYQTRQRFTIAHELGHFVLHRGKRAGFQCGKDAVHLCLGESAVIERKADEFASHLLMPSNVLRKALADQPVDSRLLSELADAFDVSFEALCIRFIKLTEQRAVLLHCSNSQFKVLRCVKPRLLGQDLPKACSARRKDLVINNFPFRTYAKRLQRRCDLLPVPGYCVATLVETALRKSCPFGMRVDGRTASLLVVAIGLSLTSPHALHYIPPHTPKTQTYSS